MDSPPGRLNVFFLFHGFIIITKFFYFLLKAVNQVDGFGCLCCGCNCLTELPGNNSRSLYSFWRVSRQSWIEHNGVWMGPHRYSLKKVHVCYMLLGKTPLWDWLKANDMFRGHSRTLWTAGNDIPDFLYP